MSEPLNPLTIAIAEARALDEARYDDWLALFAIDTRYWVTMGAQQTDPEREQSLVYEDRVLLQVRLERLKSGRAYSHRGAIVGQHVLQAPELIASDLTRGTFSTRTPFLYVEARGQEQTLFAGTATHDLRIDGERLMIVRKRVDLVNAHAALPTIFLIL
jgi:3-phenylpropionate/cinnamic acid dioxygenase small subunit